MGWFSLVEQTRHYWFVISDLVAIYDIRLPGIPTWLTPSDNEGPACLTCEDNQRHKGVLINQCPGQDMEVLSWASDMNLSTLNRTMSGVWMLGGLEAQHSTGPCQGSGLLEDSGYYQNNSRYYQNNSSHVLYGLDSNLNNKLAPISLILPKLVTLLLTNNTYKW